jgi:hypothetical protein
MTQSQAPSIFDTFNARLLSPDEVARTFVPSDAYDRLAKRRNTVIVGPRGSGKTTLLKMLQQQALEVWSHENAEHYCRRIDFTGVFVGTDVSWAEQLQSLGEDRIDQRSHKLLSIAAFTTHTLRSLTGAMLARVEEPERSLLRSFRRIPLSLEVEARLAKSLKSAWHLEAAIPTLLSIKHALTGRLASIREIATREILLGEEGRPERLANIPFLLLDFIQSAAFAVEQFNDLAGERGEKWALMFDELELAPEWIRTSLLRSLRISSENFLFKLAMSPSAPDVHTFESALAAAPGHDFDQIPLWYAEKNDSYVFCEHLWFAMLAERGISPMQPSMALGRSQFETPTEEWTSAGTAYTPGSRLGKRFIRLASTDTSFAAYLKGKGIDPLHLESLRSDQRAADVRKVAPLLAVREFYRANKGGSRRRRGRKSSVLYAGADSIFAISEGNPRWFIALVGRLLDNLDPSSLKVSASIQSKELEHAAQRFAAMLRTIPAPPVGKSSRGLLSLVREVGEFFHEGVVVGDFNPDPPGTFIVDSNIADDVVNSLERALNAGAIVYVPDDASQILLQSLRGKRFRLSYLLAPLYGFPLRLGRPVALGGLLANRMPKVIKQNQQLRLLGDVK